MSDHRLLRGPAVAVCYLVAFWSGFFVMGVGAAGRTHPAPNFGSSIYVWRAYHRLHAGAVAWLPGRRTLLAEQPEPEATRSAARHRGADHAARGAAGGYAARRPGHPHSGSALRIADRGRAAVLHSHVLLGDGVALLRVAAVDNEASSGRRAGQLYFVSTFGSAAGTLLTSFYLVLWFEVSTLLWVMIALSLGFATLSMLFNGKQRA